MHDDSACDTCALSRALCRYYTELQLLQPADSVASESDNLTVMRRIVEWMAEDGFTLELVQLLLPFGVALPLQRCLAICKVSPPGNWDPTLLHLVGRSDVVSLHRGHTQQVCHAVAHLHLYILFFMKSTRVR